MSNASFHPKNRTAICLFLTLLPYKVYSFAPRVSLHIDAHFNLIPKPTTSFTNVAATATATATSTLLTQQHYNHVRTQLHLSARKQNADNSASKDDTSTSLSKTNKTQKKKPKKKNKKRINLNESNVDLGSKDGLQTWRIFGVEVDPDSLGSDIALYASPKTPNNPVVLPAEKSYLTQPVMEALCSRLKMKPNLSLLDARVVRRSLDARKTRGRYSKSSESGNSSSANSNTLSPKYNYVIDVDLTYQVVQSLRLKHQPGRCERFARAKDKVNDIDNDNDNVNDNTNSIPEKSNSMESNINTTMDKKKKVIVVGAGPAGLFCALQLAHHENITPILLERGQPVEKRGKSIGALIHRCQMNPNSNFAFGEGGAGTWSDGKLTTRIGRNSENVRHVLQTLVKYGAPEKILVDGSPHLGTDNLVRLLRNMRLDLMNNLGGEVRFGAQVINLLKDQSNTITGVKVKYTDADNMDIETETLHADAVVIATGHSARDTYEQLAEFGVVLEPKGFATGFRVEHPQRLMNQIQYGKDWYPSVITGKKITDEANFPFSADKSKILHQGRLPVASYRLATDKAFDGVQNRGAYSFCMCPGGQIVPASTDPNEVCVNGMSFSKRDSVFANSAMVVTVSADDPILEPYRETHGVLAGIAFQRDMERRAAQMGGGNLVVPVQSLTDFVQRKTSSSSSSSSSNPPPSSYRLGVKAGVPCHEIYPESLTNALSDALLNQFERTMPGFLSDQGILHAVETRTSSPVRICRSDQNMQAIGLKRLFPAGEGAGFAGGIVSAAVDGLVIAEAILEEFQLGVSQVKSDGKKSKSVGFDY